MKAQSLMMTDLPNRLFVFVMFVFANKFGLIFHEILQIINTNAAIVAAGCYEIWMIFMYVNAHATRIGLNFELVK